MMKEEKLSKDGGSRAGSRSNGASSIHRGFSFSASRKNSLINPPILKKSDTPTKKELNAASNYIEGVKQSQVSWSPDILTIR